MVITEISADEVLGSSREALGLSVASSNGLDDAMLAASLRRAAGGLCPCSPSTLVTAVLESRGIFPKPTRIYGSASMPLQRRSSSVEICLN